MLLSLWIPTAVGDVGGGGGGLGGFHRCFTGFSLYKRDVRQASNQRAECFDRNIY